MPRPFYQGNKSNEVIIKFLQELKSIPCFSQFNLRKLIGPNGYAEQIARNVSRDVKISQLRKFFSEIKEITELGQKNPQEAQKRIWLLYPIIAYAQGRRVISRDFANMLNQVLEKVEGESCNKKEDYKRLEDFMTALVAYFKKYNPNG
jgi:CRISPR type III-A-associated protein Csm2